MARHLVAYMGNRYLDHLARDLDEMRDHGFTGVVHCVTEADLQWSRARIGEIFAATREAGFEGHADPWGVGGVFGGEAHSGFLAGHPGAGPEDPEFVAYVDEWTDAMAEAGAEWVFWDEPHGLKTPAAALAFLDHATRRARDAGLKSSVCLYPMEGERAEAMGLPPLEAVAGLPAVDEIAVDPYPIFLMGPLGQSRGYHDFDAERFVGHWADRLLAVAGEAGVTAHLWIQGFGIPAGYEHLVGDCAAVARGHGLNDLAFWCYRGGEAGTSIHNGDPAAVWAAAKEAFFR